MKPLRFLHDSFLEYFTTWMLAVGVVLVGVFGHAIKRPLSYVPRVVGQAVAPVAERSQYSDMPWEEIVLSVVVLMISIPAVRHRREEEESQQLEEARRLRLAQQEAELARIMAGISTHSNQ